MAEECCMAEIDKHKVKITKIAQDKHKVKIMKIA